MFIQGRFAHTRSQSPRIGTMQLSSPLNGKEDGANTTTSPGVVCLFFNVSTRVCECYQFHAQMLHRMSRSAKELKEFVREPPERECCIVRACLCLCVLACVRACVQVSVGKQKLSGPVSHTPIKTSPDIFVRRLATLDRAPAVSTNKREP